jgi:hypothetical protein
VIVEFNLQRARIDTFAIGLGPEDDAARAFLEIVAADSGGQTLQVYGTAPDPALGPVGD